MKRTSSTAISPDGSFVKRPHHDQTQVRQQKNDTNDQADQKKAAAEKLKLAHERMKYDVNAYQKEIRFSHFYKDDTYQYRHITLPPQIAVYLPDKKKLLRETEIRRLGINISSGWEHYMIYQPEPNILLLRRTHEMARQVEAAHKAYLQRKNEEEAAAGLEKKKGNDAAAVSWQQTKGMGIYRAQTTLARRKITNKGDVVED